MSAALRSKIFIYGKSLFMVRQALEKVLWVDDWRRNCGCPLLT